jgi:heme A synthase
MITVFYTIFVILFGAVVRITGSGAGCGQHWPTCHGEIAHLPKSLETFIELGHRLTSGLSMLLVFALAVWTFRVLPRGHAARRAAVWSSVFMMSEALLGAALVLLALVGQNDSVSRALVMALHLVNTSALLLAMVSAAWACRSLERRELFLFTRPQSSSGAAASRAQSLFLDNHGYWFGALLIVLVSAAGAVTALGDTVYPVGERASLEVAAELINTDAHFLEHVRGFHPIFASMAACFWIAFGARVPGTWGRVIVSLTVIQVMIGLVNIYLRAPGYMQVVHLAFANALFLAWVMAWLGRFSQHEQVNS